jgi:O-antigen/teichoic acid export membrane protein
MLLHQRIKLGIQYLAAPMIAAFGLRFMFMASGLLTSLMLARMLSPAGMGAYTEVVAWALLIGGLCQAGWVPFLIREIAVRRSAGRSDQIRGLATSSTWIVTAIGAVGGMAFMLWVRLDAGYAAKEELRLFTVPLVLAISVSAIWQAQVRALGRPLWGQVADYLVRPTSQIILLACLAAGVIAQPSVPAALTVLLLSSIAGVAVAYLLQRRAIRDLPAGERPEPLGMLLNKSMLLNTLIAWASTLNAQIGIILLAQTAPASDVAQFRVAQQLSILMSTGLIVSATLYAPRLSELVQLGRIDELRRISRRICAVSLAFALPIALVYFLMPGATLRLAFGNYYSTATLSLTCLTVGQLVNAAFGAVTPLAIATRNERGALLVHVISVSVNLVLCLALVPQLGALGAAIGASASLISWNLLLFILLWKRTGIRSFAFMG